MSEIINALSADLVRDQMQASGYRVELVTDPGTGTKLLRSATNGLNFDIRFGNKLSDDTDGYADVALIAFFDIVGDLPLEPINQWNNTRRFCRLQIDRNTPKRSFLVLCMDISVAGGVTPNYLRTQIEIWDGLVQQFVPWLRQELGQLAPATTEEQKVEQPDSSARKRTAEAVTARS